MKIFTDEFEDMLVNAVGCGVLIVLALLAVGIVGGIEQGLIGR